MIKSICKFISTLFYIGCFPIAPGTIGTIAAFAVYLLIPVSFLEHPLFWVFPVLLTLPIVIVADEAEKIMEKDDQRIVIDEFLGYFFAVLFLPKSLLIGGTAFVLFRIFDIAKPPPVNEIQNWKGGWGIVCDDIMSGIYANLVLQVIYFVIVSAL